MNYGLMNYEELINDISHINNTAQTAVVRAINQIQTIRNWFIGAYIVEYEQNGVDRAAYGTQLIKKLADDLKHRSIEGLSDRNLKNFRQFALTYPGLAKNENLSAFLPLISLPVSNLPIRQTVSAEFKTIPQNLFPALEAREQQQPSLSWQDNGYYQRLFTSLSWSHMLELTRIEDTTKRAFYELECIKGNWSIRELKRQMNSMLYERVGLSKDKDAVLALANQGQILDSPKNVLRDPYVLEFLGLEERNTYSESELEQALIDHLQDFMHELGRDFCFVDRQYRITVDAEHYFIDLLFYHRALRCLIAIDLKLGKFRHDYAGQMNFYLNYLKENVTYPHENPPVGILLCAEKDAEAVHYATAGLDNQLFVSRYLVALPSEETLKKWLKEEQDRLEQKFDFDTEREK
ncbi:PDDEXK nuclease domain-containing protein [Nostoc sp. CCY 9925]|uniref:PDDEXK nuclease domain-containing protein n=1 Tax=Nostoc sp. CCY 9925 TaxID=3103865 RepID=UPI0039C64E5A